MNESEFRVWSILLVLTACLAVARAAEAGDDASADPCELQMLFDPVAHSGEAFGKSVALWGDRAVVGNWRDDDVNVNSGAAHVFQLIEGDWVETQKLTPPDLDWGDNLGWAVAGRGNVIVAGAPGVDVGGAIYVFRWNGSTWQQEEKLTALDAVVSHTLGGQVATNGSVIVGGVPDDDDQAENAGAVYVFRWNGDTWIEEQKLTASDGEAGDVLGQVAVLGEVIVAGARDDDDMGENAGAVYVFRWNGETWIEEQKLTATEGAAFDGFGGSVAVSEDLIVAGATGASVGGAAFVFRFDGVSWFQDQMLTPSDGADLDQFGTAVAHSNGRILIGSEWADPFGNRSGAAYLFQDNGTSWVEVSKLTASDASSEDFFGVDVAVDGNVAMIGAPGADGSASGDGVVYVFDVVCEPCLDLSGDGAVGVLDLIIVINSWGQSGVPADLDGDGVVGVLDLVELIVAWGPC